MKIDGSRAFLALIVVLGVAIWLGMFHTSLREGAEKLEGLLLLEKPKGTSFSEVERWLKDEKKLSPKLSREAGFLKQSTSGNSIIGKQSISASLGEYRSFPFLRTSVMGYWGFDEAGKLIDVWVWKTTDAP